MNVDCLLDEVLGDFDSPFNRKVKEALCLKSVLHPSKQMIYLCSNQVELIDDYLFA